MKSTPVLIAALLALQITRAAAASVVITQPIDPKFDLVPVAPGDVFRWEAPLAGGPVVIGAGDTVSVSIPFLNTRILQWSAGSISSIRLRLSNDGGPGTTSSISNQVLSFLGAAGSSLNNPANNGAGGVFNSAGVSLESEFGAAAMGLDPGEVVQFGGVVFAFDVDSLSTSPGTFTDLSLTISVSEGVGGELTVIPESASSALVILAMACAVARRKRGS